MNKARIALSSVFRTVRVVREIFGRNHLKPVEYRSHLVVRDGPGLPYLAGSFSSRCSRVEMVSMPGSWEAEEGAGSQGGGSSGTRWRSSNGREFSLDPLSETRLSAQGQFICFARAERQRPRKGYTVHVTWSRTMTAVRIPSALHTGLVNVPTHTRDQRCQIVS